MTKINPSGFTRRGIVPTNIRAMGVNPVFHFKAFWSSSLSYSVSV